MKLADASRKSLIKEELQKGDLGRTRLWKSCIHSLKVRADRHQQTAEFDILPEREFWVTVGRAAEKESKSICETLMWLMDQPCKGQDPPHPLMGLARIC